MANWQNSLKIHDPLDNQVIQADFIQTMIADHVLFRNYYDASNVKVIDGGTAKFIGSTHANGPRKWKFGQSRENFPRSKKFEQELKLVEYGMFGDVASYDFDKLAFSKPDILRKIFADKIDCIFDKWKRAVEDHMLFLMCDKKNYWKESRVLNPNNPATRVDNNKAWIVKPSGYFNPSDDPEDMLKNQARASSFLREIEAKLYDFTKYSRDYNIDEQEAVTQGMNNITILFHPIVNSFLGHNVYAQTYNVKYVELSNKVGNIIVAHLPEWKAGDVAYVDGDANGNDVNITATEDNAFKWRALIHDRNFYKIFEAIDHPGNTEVFMDSSHYNFDLTSYVGKWWFCFEGVIKFVNALAIVEEWPRETA